jgi:Concanavalin A-like lectin/glucanases superfamily
MKVKVLGAASAAALGVAVLTALPVVQASAASSAPLAKTVAAANAPAPLAVGQSDGNLSSNALQSWQTDNTVWSTVYANGVVYVGGQFLNARPPGAANGSTTGEVSRTYLAAFNSTTGALITSFDPVITESGTSTPVGVYSMAVSPDGSTLYVGGLFNHVNGSYRDNLAAFNTSTGALTNWQPSAYGKVNAIAVSPDNKTVYIGGGFNQLGTAGSVSGIQARTYVGAVDSSGNLLPWAPVVDNALTALAADPDGSQVLLGGYFSSLNGVHQPGAGAVDATTGTTNITWGANIVPDSGSCFPPAIKDIIVSNGDAYLSAEGTGGGCFDGDFSVSLSPTNDTLVWTNACLGATQSIAIINGYLFKGSHAHDCAYAPGGFPQVNNNSGGWITHHLLDQSLVDGSVGHWTPNTDGTTLGPRAMATDGKQLFVGGDFLNVNGKPQQGFAIFPAKPDSVYPSNPTATPTVSSTSAGTVTVQFPAVSSADVGTLNYQIFRDGGKTAIATITATSWPWALPLLTFQDTGLTPGSQHTYQYAATDGTHLSGRSPASASVTVSSTSPAASYNQTVLNSNPSFFWPLNDSGSTANDATSNNTDGTYTGGVTQGAAGPLTGSTATSFDGQSGGVFAQSQVSGSQNFSIEGWFKTTANTGGVIMGFGNSQTGMSSSYDRHLYMMNDGQLVFGVWNNATETVESADTYNDGQWHYFVASYNQSASNPNMALYVDGQLVGTTSSSAAQVYNGFWRIGGDNLNGWNLDPWGSNSEGTTEPISYYFQGTIADVAVYPTALSAAQVQAHFAAGLAQGG